jgi:hypothetical protein
MTPLKFIVPNQFAQRIRKGKKMMEEATKVVYVDEIPLTKSESIISMLV